MTTFYNCKHDGDQYRVTKFNKDLEVESSYLCTLSECECPAGVRPSCRHRDMLPRFIQRDHIGDNWFYDFDRGGWVQMDLGGDSASEALPIQPVPVTLAPQPVLEAQPIDITSRELYPLHSPTPTIRRRV